MTAKELKSYFPTAHPRRKGLNLGSRITDEDFSDLLRLREETGAPLTVCVAAVVRAGLDALAAAGVADAVCEGFCDPVPTPATDTTDTTPTDAAGGIDPEKIRSVEMLGFEISDDGITEHRNINGEWWRLWYGAGTGEWERCGDTAPTRDELRATLEAGGYRYARTRDEAMAIYAPAKAEEKGTER